MRNRASFLGSLNLKVVDFHCTKLAHLWKRILQNFYSMSKNNAAETGFLVRKFPFQVGDDGSLLPEVVLRNSTVNIVRGSKA
jgi:hypothetical protein